MHKTIIVLSLLISACSNSPETDAQKAVLSRLTDPDSAKFGEFTIANEHSACLGVNAKNKLGGYTGEQQALLIRGPIGWEVADISRVDQTTCLSIANSINYSSLNKAK